MPYAIERSVARPTIRARLPARNPMGCSGVDAAVKCSARTRRQIPARAVRDVHDQALARLDHAARAQVVPAEQVGQAHAELGGDARQRVAPAHHVGRGARLDGLRVRRGERRRSGNRQHLADGERVVARQAVAARDALHRHAVRARDAPQRVAATHDVLVGRVARRRRFDATQCACRSAGAMPVGAAVISRSWPGRISVPRILFAVLIAAIDTPYLSAMPPSVSPLRTW